MQSDGKVAVITGDTRRIGLSFAGSFLAGGTRSNGAVEIGRPK